MTLYWRFFRIKSAKVIGSWLISKRLLRFTDSRKRQRS